MTQTIESAGLTFLCDDPLEVWRAQTLAEKEPGTIEWLNELQSGDVFFDVGANIGVYSLYAAQRGARVFAFEPHAINALHLARNADANRLDITVVNAAVGNPGSRRWWPFRYHTLRPGSAAGNAIYRFGEQAIFKSEMRILATSIDEWAEDLGDNARLFVKVDTDGDEKLVIQGACYALRDGKIASLQMEVHPQVNIVEHLADYDYEPVRVHYTSNGEAAIKKGADPATVICNTIFRRCSR